MKVVDLPVSGLAQGPFAPMLQLFGRAVGAQGGGGASLAVYHRGEKVVDLIAGDFLNDTVMLTFSVSKAVSAVAVHHAIDAGRLEMDLHLHEIWPAFGRSPRARAITLDHVLTHSSGLPTVERKLSVEDHIAGGLTTALETQEPFWDPGSLHGYHAFTFGGLLSGVFEHALGVTMREYIETHIASPLGLDLSLGLTEEQRGRLRLFQRPVQAVTPLEREMAGRHDLIRDGAGEEVWADMLVFNRAEVLGSPWPSTNIVTSARDLAHMFAATLASAKGARLLSDRGLKRMSTLRYRGEDRMLGFPIAYGSGVQLPFPQLPLFGEGSFGHEGAGGSLLAVDPARDLTLAYLTDVYPASNGASAVSYALVAGVAHIVDNGLADEV